MGFFLTRSMPPQRETLVGRFGAGMGRSAIGPSPGDSCHSATDLLQDIHWLERGITNRTHAFGRERTRRTAGFPFSQAQTPHIQAAAPRMIPPELPQGLAELVSALDRRLDLVPVIHSWIAVQPSPAFPERVRMPICCCYTVLGFMASQ